MDSLFTGVILNFKKYLFLLLGPATAYGRLADPNRIKRHFLKMRISPVNKENNPLFFTAMTCGWGWATNTYLKRHRLCSIKQNILQSSTTFFSSFFWSLQVAYANIKLIEGKYYAPQDNIIISMRLWAESSVN